MNHPVYTLGDLLTGHHRVLFAQVTQLKGCTYDKRGPALTHWLRKYQNCKVVNSIEGCGQMHYIVVDKDFALAVVAVEEPIVRAARDEVIVGHFEEGE